MMTASNFRGNFCRNAQSFFGSPSKNASRPASFFFAAASRSSSEMPSASQAKSENAAATTFGNACTELIRNSLSRML